jgi:hypothetical protein
MAPATKAAQSARMKKSSDRQVAANRLNAKRSTGPRTLAGKAKVSVNAVKHGLTGRDVVLPGENAEDFDTFRSELLTCLDPQTALESSLAEKIVADAWRLRRAVTFEAALYKRGCMELLVRQAAELVARYESTEKDRVLASLERKKVAARDRQAHENAVKRLAYARAELDDPSFNITRVLKMSPETFKNLDRHEAALSRSMLRTLHELERWQAKRAGELVPVPSLVDVDLTVSEAAGNDVGVAGSQETEEKSTIDRRHLG